MPFACFQLHVSLLTVALSIILFVWASGYKELTGQQKLYWHVSNPVPDKHGDPADCS